MSKFESGIKHIPHPQTAVYNVLSDLSNLDKVKDKLPEDKIKDLSFDSDSLTIGAPMGSVSMSYRSKLVDSDCSGRGRCMQDEADDKG